MTVKDELRGKRVRCPKCKELFRADEVDAKTTKAAAAPRPKTKPPRGNDDDDDDGDSDLERNEPTPDSPEDRRRKRQRDKRARLRKVSTGLLIHTCKTWGVTVWLFFQLLYVIFAAIYVVGQEKGENRLAEGALQFFYLMKFISLSFIVVLAFAASISGIVGSVFCCMAPKKAEVRGMAMTAIVFDAITFIAVLVAVLAGIGAFTGNEDKKERIVGYLQPAAITCAIATFFSFAIYLRQLANFVKKPDIGTKALTSLTYLCIIVVSLPAIILSGTLVMSLIYSMLGPPGTLSVFFLVITTWFAGYYYLWFQPTLKMMSDLRATIAEVT